MRKLVLAGLIAGLFSVPANAEARPTPIRMPAQSVFGTIQVERSDYGCGRDWCRHGVASPLTVQASGFWDVVECAGAIGLFVAGNTLLVAKARKAGGIYRVAKRVWKSKSKIKKLQALQGFFGEVTGLAAVVKGCR